MASAFLSLALALSWTQWMILVGVICLTYLYFKSQAPFKKFGHVAQVKPHWYLGNKNFGTEALLDTHLNHYNSLKGNRYGIFWEGNVPAFYILDLELIKKIQISDFDHFMDLGFVSIEYNKAVGNQFGLADTFGEPWKRMKKMITPPFSIPRLRKTTPTMNKAVMKMIKYLKTLEKKGDVVDMTRAVQKYAMTIIGSVGFGMDMDPFTEERRSDLEQYGIDLLVMWRLLLNDLWPNLMIFFKISLANPKSIDYIKDLFSKLIKQRKESQVEGKDVLGNFMQASKENPDLTEDMMVKSFLQFFTDGYATASDVLGVMIYLLTINPQIQERAQEEIDEVLEGKEGNDEITNAEFEQMTYMDQVISEGLRIGPAAFTNRFCTKDWKIPGDDLVIPQGAKVYIPIGGLHYDEDYFEDPYKFDPDRFSPENKGNIPAGAFQPFGSGPRMCLGYNMFKLETKIMLVHLLRNFSLKKHGEMPEKIEWDLNTFVGVKGGVKIKLAKRI